MVFTKPTCGRTGKIAVGSAFRCMSSARAASRRHPKAAAAGRMPSFRVGSLATIGTGSNASRMAIGLPTKSLEGGDAKAGAYRRPRKRSGMAAGSAGDGKLASVYAAQLIALMPDVILVSSTPNLLVIREATKNVPVVFVNVSDPVTQGFVANIRQPGGNLTGFSLYEFSIGGKWLSLLKEAAPGLARVAVMFNPDTSPQSKFYMRAIDSVAPSLGVQAIPTPVRATAEIESALATFARQPNGGLILPTDTFIRLNHMLIADLAGRYRLPSISAYPEFVKDGGLMEYSSTIDRTAQLREAANYIGLILKGSRVGDLPVQAPDKYRFVLNMKTAKALGVTLPPTMLAIADEVIQ
jgi:putative ABC transport system substrate-binding protein